jgi:hypothetical protein
LFYYTVLALLYCHSDDSIVLHLPVGLNLYNIEQIADALVVVTQRVAVDEHDNRVAGIGLPL